MTPHTAQMQPAIRHAAPPLARQLRGVIAAGAVTLLATLLLLAYLLPMGYAMVSSLAGESIAEGAPILPALPATFSYQGQRYEIYRVPLDGGPRELALVKKGREQSTFVDPNNPEQPIVWQGRWRTLDQVWRLAPTWENYPRAWEAISFPRLFLNTLGIALIGMAGTLISSTLVAYGFSHFRFPGRQALFLIVIGTIILPPQVTLIPTYSMFVWLGWTGSWLPLTVPHFFGSAYNIFLLRQFFLTIPRDLDEAAMIDGAGPLKTLLFVILPQALPALVAVGLFHFFWAWNDFFGPLIYLVGKPDLYPIAIGLQQFNGLYAKFPNLIQAASLTAVAFPLALFFLAQRFFVQGVVMTGVEK